MSLAPPYNPTASFANDETNQVSGRSTVRTVAVDTELANIATSINALKSNLEKVQRDDDKLRDFLIEPYALAEQTRALIAVAGKPRGLWVTGTVYAVGDVVQQAGIAYQCYTAHTASSPFTANGFWIAISGDGSAAGSASAAASSATSAANSATSASSSSSTATTKAGEANTSATNAANSATSSSNSATASASSATASATSATSAGNSFNSFDARYLGAKASDPTLNNTGGALAVGALYHNTTQNMLKVYTGSVWLGSPGDSSTVNYMPAGTGAVPRTMQDKGRESVSILDYYQDADAGDYGPGLIRALAVSNKVFFPDKGSAYTFTSTVNHVLTADTVIDFNGQRCIFTNAKINLSGDLVASGLTLAANPARYATAVTLNNAAAVLPGDLVLINTTIAPSTDWSDTKKDCVRVRSKSDNTLTLDEGLNFAYTTADAGLTVTVYRPFGLTLLRPNLELVAAQGDTNAYIMIVATGLINVRVVEPSIKGQYPFTRDTNIFRNGIWFLACYGVDIQAPYYEAMSYGTGAYTGTRNITERGVVARYMHHSHCDCGDWSSDYLLQGLHSSDSYQAINTHPVFRAFADGFDVKNDFGLINWRCFGGGIRNGTVQSTTDDTQELPQFQNAVPAVGYEYLYDDADFHAVNVVFSTPGRITKAPLGVRFGRSIYIERVTAPDIWVSWVAVNDCDVAIFGPGNNVGGHGAPSVLNVRCRARVLIPTQLDAVLDTGVYRINPRARMVDHGTSRLTCEGVIASGLTADPAVLPLRIHVNAIAGQNQQDVVIGKLKLFAVVRHQNTGFFSTIEKHFNFGFNVTATSALTFPTTAVYTSGLSGQFNESITLTVANPTFAGVTQIGTNADHYLQIDVSVGSGRTVPLSALRYELELIRG